MGHEVPDSEAWKREEFCKGAQHKKVSPLAGQLGKRTLGGEVDKGFINHEMNAPPRAGVHDLREDLRRNHCAGGVIGIAQNQHVGSFICQAPK